MTATDSRLADIESAALRAANAKTEVLKAFADLDHVNPNPAIEEVRKDSLIQLIEDGALRAVRAANKAVDLARTIETEQAWSYAIAATEHAHTCSVAAGRIWS